MSLRFATVTRPERHIYEYTQVFRADIVLNGLIEEGCPGLRVGRI